MNKKRRAMFAISAILILVIIIGLVFKPRPIVPEQDDLIIGFILKITDDGGGSEFIEDYDTDEILAFLQNCTERMTLERENGGLMGDIELQMLIHGDNFSKVIILGKTNYSYTGTMKYKIINGDDVKSTLLEMLGIEDTN